MMSRRFRRIGVAEVVFIGLVFILVLGVLVLQRRGTSDHPSGVSAAVASATSGPTPTLVSSMPDATPSVVQSTAEVSSPTPGPGTPIALPSDRSAGGIRLIATETAPPISQDAAVAIVASLGVSFANADTYRDQLVTLSAAFGVGTVGTSAEDGTWLGPSNIPLPDGQVLDHIENRLVWVLDYQYAGEPAPGAEEAGIIDHAVYIVDAETQLVLIVMQYPSS